MAVLCVHTPLEFLCIAGASRGMAVLFDFEGRTELELLGSLSEQPRYVLLDKEGKTAYVGPQEGRFAESELWKRVRELR